MAWSRSQSLLLDRNFPGSRDRKAAVDDDRVAGMVGTRVGCEINGYPTKVFRMPPSPRRNAPKCLGSDPFPKLAAKVGLNPSGHDCIGPHTPPRHLDGDRAHEARNGTLCRCISMKERCSEPTGEGRAHDD